MFLAKNLLIGLGSVGVIGGGGYMIYNATKSGDSKEEIKDETEKTQSIQENNKDVPISTTPAVSPQVPASGDQQIK